MARIYAGMMSLLAMLTIIVRGMKNGAGIEGTLGTALLGLIVFMLAGFLFGSIAESIVTESVRNEMESRLAEAEKESKKV